MIEIYIALISGEMALLGAGLSGFITYKISKQQQNADRQRHLMHEKEDLYHKVFIALGIAEFDNPYLSEPPLKLCDGELENIEVLLQIYAPKEVIKKYHHAMEAVVGRLPLPVINNRLDSLKHEIRKDLGISDS